MMNDHFNSDVVKIYSHCRAKPNHTPRSTSESKLALDYDFLRIRILASFLNPVLKFGSLSKKSAGNISRFDNSLKKAIICLFTVTINPPLTRFVAQTKEHANEGFRGFRCASQKPESGVNVTRVTVVVTKDALG